MGMYLNPGNAGFEIIKKGRYIDKTGMIGLVNQRISTPGNLICISRPRRFGKSYAAQMLCAYYDKTCDSSALFDDLAVRNDPSYDRFLNKFDVIYLDMAAVMGSVSDKDEVIPFLSRSLIKEIREQYPEAKQEETLVGTLLQTAVYTGSRFIMLIDEWDAPIREMPGKEKEYIQFLRTLFKNSGATSRIFAAVYMTGILPIKKDGSQSAISDFEEYTMLSPAMFAQYTGFTETEVCSLCKEEGADFEIMKQWYDGYHLAGTGSIYNPNSVMKAISRGRFESYWTKTSAADNLMKYISLGYAGLSRTIAGLMAGIRVQVDTDGFSNDLVSFKCKDDVLTLLVHLGYLAYDEDTGTVSIPNEEISREFSRTVRKTDHTETLEHLAESDKLLDDTVHMRAKLVAAQIERIHAEETAPLHYNREDSLRSVIKLAYYTYKDHYLQWEELPAGTGYADVVYLPKKDSGYPALVVELKWNMSANAAIDQILDRQYPEALKGYGGEILLVGISYDKDAPPGSRKHSCVIRQV